MYTKTPLINNTSALIVIFIIALISGSTSSLVFAVSPSNGFKSASDCSEQLVGSMLKTTCCWTHATEIYSPNTSRCQTCNNRIGTYSNCTDVFIPRNSDSTNHYPQTQGGIVNVNGDRNMFLHYNVWDIWKNSSAPSMTISTNAKSTKGIGGILTVQTYSDSGTKTHIDDQWSGLSTKNPVSVYDQLKLYGNTDTLEG